MSLSFFSLITSILFYELHFFLFVRKIRWDYTIVAAFVRSRLLHMHWLLSGCHGLAEKRFVLSSYSQRRPLNLVPLARGMSRGLKNLLVFLEKLY